MKQTTTSFRTNTIVTLKIPITSVQCKPNLWLIKDGEFSPVLPAVYF